MQQSNAGGLHDTPLLGSADAVSASNQLAWLVLLRQQTVSILSAVIFAMLTILAFVLFLYNRADYAYLWMAATCLIVTLIDCEYAASALGRELFTATTDHWLGDVLAISLIRFGWFMLIRAWFELSRHRWMPWTVGLLAFVRIVVSAESLGLFSFIPAALSPVCTSIALAVFFAGLLLLSWLVADGLHKMPVDGWLFLPVVTLSWVDWLSATFPSLRIPRVFSPFGFWAPAALSRGSRLPSL